MKAIAVLPAALLLALTGGMLAPAQARVRSTTISWSGYTWVARSAPGNPGAPQAWSPGNVSVDSAGRLHLKVTRDKHGHYAQAELDSTRNGWGYGTYRWQVASDVSQQAPEYVLGLFTYGRDAAYGHREIDIEASGWGTTPITWDYTTWANGQDSVARTPAPAGASTQQFVWQPGLLTWSSWDAAGNLIGTATASGADVPVPYDESIGMNFWLCGCASGWNSTPAAEVVISGFSFTPYSG
ncbi:MAG TPA: glycoside hydrolase family 16 protein [Nocardioides sp.]|nr:glycoside hydrolase family 16 protein [Nocardioides sp.]